MAKGQDFEACVVFTGGQLDVEASYKKLTEAFTRHLEERGSNWAELSGAVDSVFDQFPEARINFVYLSGKVLEILKVSPDRAGKVSQKLREYLSTSGRFESGRGPSGGYKRIMAPVSAPEETAPQSIH